MCEIKKIKCLNKSCIMILSTPSPRGGKPLEYEVQNLLKIFTLVIFLPYCGTLFYTLLWCWLCKPVNIFHGLKC